MPGPNHPRKRHALVMPDLGLGPLPTTASVWLAEVGREVIEGDRLLEINAGELTVDLPAPATGLLVQQCVAEDDPVCAGQVLGYVEASS